MQKMIIALFAAMGLAACGGSETVKPVAEVQVNPKTATWIEYSIPFKKDAPIAKNVKVECELGPKFSGFIKQYGDEKGVAIYRAQKGARKNRNRLVVEIVDAVSAGNAFIGHRKYAKARGTLYKNGKKIASFTSGRVSGGGMFGNWKGSCAVLGRTVKAMGRDIAEWMKHPANGVNLGDAI